MDPNSFFLGRNGTNNYEQPRSIPLVPFRSFSCSLEGVKTRPEVPPNRGMIRSHPWMINPCVPPQLQQPGDETGVPWVDTAPQGEETPISMRITAGCG